MKHPYDQSSSVIRTSYYHHAASASVWAAPLVFVLGIITTVSSTGMDPNSARMVGMVTGFFSGLLLILGLLAGIVALFGIPEYGTDRILGKALIGILLPIGLTALAIPTVMHAYSMAQQLQGQSPAQVQEQSGSQAPGLPSIEVQLQAAVDEINKGGPKTVDSDTRFEKAELLPNRTIRYHYTLTNLNRIDIDSGAINKVIRPGLLDSYRNAESMKYFRDSAVTVVYTYVDKAGEEVGDTSVGPADLKTE